MSSADAVKLDVKWGSLVTHGMMPLEGNLEWLDKRIRCNPLTNRNLTCGIERTFLLSQS